MGDNVKNSPVVGHVNQNVKICTADALPSAGVQEKPTGNDATDTGQDISAKIAALPQSYAELTDIQREILSVLRTLTILEQSKALIYINQLKEEQSR
jgi:hypothetical protein